MDELRIGDRVRVTRGTWDKGRTGTVRERHGARCLIVFDTRGGAAGFPERWLSARSLAKLPPAISGRGE